MTFPVEGNEDHKVDNDASSLSGAEMAPSADPPSEETCIWILRPGAEGILW